jgi:pentatricopeptide repeat domain-containing protein 1
MKLLREMVKEGDTKPNIRTFNMILNAWARQKDAEQARWVMSLMRTAGIAPDVISYNTLAQVFCSLCPLFLWAIASNIL